MFRLRLGHLLTVIAVTPLLLAGCAAGGGSRLGSPAESGPETPGAVTQSLPATRMYSGHSLTLRSAAPAGSSMVMPAPPGPLSDTPAAAASRGHGVLLTQGAQLDSAGPPRPDVGNPGLDTAPPAGPLGSDVGYPAPDTVWTPEPTVAPPLDMFFRDYGSNPWEDPRRDNLSTFAMDVDTGAYTVLRSYLREGFLPPAAAIRVEELVNYFDQDYPAPDGAAFRISADGAPSPFGERHGTLVRVGIQGRQADALPELDAVLTFVVDASGSMADGERLELVKAALRRLVDQLDAGDEVGIVAFSDQAWVALPTTSVGQQSAILEAIDALEPQASTNAEAGLVQGYELAERAFRRGAINRVILCSDGVANVGAVMPEDILERIRRGAERDLTLTTVGVGMGNYNDVLMEQLADRGDGAYFYVDDLRQAERIFVDRLAGTLQVIARDAKTQVELNPEVVAAYRLIGYENRGLADSDFDRPEVDAGEIGAGQSVTALYSVQLHPEARGRLATVRIRYREPDSGGNREVSTELHTADLAERFDQAAPRFRLDVAVAAFAEALRQQGDYQQLWLDDVIQIAEAAARDLGDADATELVELMGRARALVTYTTR